VNTRLLISDSSVLIDMVDGGLATEMFQLDWEFAVPDVLFHDELREYHGDLPGKGLHQMAMSPDAIAEISSVQAKHSKSGVSFYDCAGLVLAQREDCPLLAGDGALRQVAMAEGVVVRGTIWIVGELLDAGIIDTERAKTAYKMMKAQGSRLPWDKAEEQIQHYIDNYLGTK